MKWICVKSRCTQQDIIAESPFTAVSALKWVQMYKQQYYCWGQIESWQSAAEGIAAALPLMTVRCVCVQAACTGSFHESYIYYLSLLSDTMVLSDTLHDLQGQRMWLHIWTSTRAHTCTRTHTHTHRTPSAINKLNPVFKRICLNQTLIFLFTV